MSNIDLGSKPKAGGIKPNEQQKIQIARAIQGFKSPSFFGPIAEYAPLGFDIISDATGQGFAADNYRFILYERFQRQIIPFTHFLAGTNGDACSSFSEST